MNRNVSSPASGVIPANCTPRGGEYPCQSRSPAMIRPSGGPVVPAAAPPTQFPSRSSDHWSVRTIGLISSPPPLPIPSVPYSVFTSRFSVS